VCARARASGVCPIVCDFETSTVKRPRAELGCSAIGNEKYSVDGR